MVTTPRSPISVTTRRHSDLVLYYGDVGYWNGIVRIGRFDSAQLSLIEGQPDGFEVTVEIA